MGDLADEVLEDFKNNVVSEYLQPSNVSNSMDQDNFSMFDNSFMNTDSKIIPANHICKKILYIPICEGTSVRTWDVLLFLPNLAFVIFLAIRWSSTKRKLAAGRRDHACLVHLWSNSTGRMEKKSLSLSFPT